MTKQEFMYSVPHLIFKEVAKNVNQLIGLSKTSAAIANLLTTLPMQVELRHMTNQPKPSKKLNALNEFVHAYIKHDDSTKVYIAFFYKNEKNKILTAQNKKYVNKFIRQVIVKNEKETNRDTRRTI